MTMPNDPFPASEFDPWADTYDQDVAAQSPFPFDGYERVLDTVVRLAMSAPGMSVLDIGTGTGNLAGRFSMQGCELWCTDFSEAMLQKARAKLPNAHFVLHDLRASWPRELQRGFDRIVSAYVFHHFELEKKVELCRSLAAKRLKTAGKLIIADLSFPDKKAMETFAATVGPQWEEEPYWLADEAIAALQLASLRAEYIQVSACAGVYLISP
jgi:putative AdoMet-dependent methyltransferase